MGWQIGMMCQMLLGLTQTCLIAIIAFPFFSLILPVIFGIAYILINSAAASIKETVRIYSTTKSPILSYLGESIAGASTIRAFGRVSDFEQGCFNLLNRNILSL